MEINHTKKKKKNLVSHVLFKEPGKTSNMHKITLYSR